MKTSLSFILIFIFLHFAQAADLWPKQDECGKLNLDNFYKPTNITALDEYPWIARVGYEEKTEEISYRCLAVLISRRYLVSAAHCFSRNLVANHVLLGDWNPENDPSEVDCDESGKCGLQPRKYEVEEIIIHPDHNRHDNDIALLRLTSDVTFTDFIRPACMPPKNQDDTDFTGQYLPYAGFTIDRNNRNGIRTKMLLHIFSHKRCKEALEKLRIKGLENVFCGTASAELSLMSGAPVMATNLVDGELHSLYLLGIVTGGSRVPGTAVPDLIMRISKYRDWIDFNVVE